MNDHRIAAENAFDSETERLMAIIPPRTWSKVVKLIQRGLNENMLDRLGVDTRGYMDPALKQQLQNLERRIVSQMNRDQQLPERTE